MKKKMKKHNKTTCISKIKILSLKIKLHTVLILFAI